MKNNKGFTLVELLAVIVIMAIILAIAIPTISGLINTAKNNAFKINEKIILKAAKTYFEGSDVDIPINAGETTEIKISDLQNNNYLSQITSPIDKTKLCNGYVLMTKISDTEYDYTPHINCVNNIGSSEEDGLIGHWKLNNIKNGKTYDYSKNSRHGTTYNVTLTTDRMGTSNSALNFNGSNGYVLIGSLSNLTSNLVSVSAWVKRGTSEGWNGSLFGFGTDISNTQDIYFWGSDNSKQFGYNTWNGDSWGINNSTTYGQAIDGNWHHVVGVFTRNNIKASSLYVDGVKLSISQVRGSTQDRLISNNFGIGLNGWHYGDQLFNGTMSDVRVYNRALSEGEISQLYNYGL